MKNAYKTIALIAGAMLLVSFLLPVLKLNAVKASSCLSHEIFSDDFESGDFSKWDRFDAWIINHRSTSTYKTEIVNDTDPGNDILRKEISTAGYQNIVIKYEYRIPTAKALETTDHVYVEWRDGSNNWHELANYTDVSQNSWTSTLFNLPTEANNLTNFRLRFRADLNDSDDSFRLDNVSITGNHAPVALDDNISPINEDSTANITLHANENDCGDSLTYSIVTEPSNGIVTLVGDIATYTPNTNYNGLDSFTFKASDGIADSNIATISLTINSVEDIPVANDQEITIYKNTPTWFDITGSDGDGDPLTYIIVSQPTVGHISNTAPHIKYTSGLDALGADSFTFKVNDGANDSSIATVSINVVEVPVGGGCGGQCQSGSSGEVLGASIETIPTPSPTIEPESTPTPTPAGEPEVLGETTCGEIITEHLWFGGNNNSDQVKLLQQFLNEQINAELPITGYFGTLTKAAVIAFQEKHSDKILQPWIDLGLLPEKKGTGNVFKTTKWWINMTACPSLNLTQPIIP